MVELMEFKCRTSGPCTQIDLDNLKRWRIEIKKKAYNQIGVAQPLCKLYFVLVVHSFFFTLIASRILF